MPAKDSFLTIKSEVIAEEVVKGSKFIAHASPASTREAAKNYVDKISAKFKDATHNCFAYKIGTGDKAAIRFQDAGEPSGTAGRPILQAIEAKNLSNIVIVVTRYFGGTKLGTGGLIRAYSSAALAALNRAATIEHYPQVVLKLVLPYELTKTAQHLIQKFDANILDSKFEEQVSYLVRLKIADEAKFKREMQNASGGKIKFSCANE